MCGFPGPGNLCFFATVRLSEEQGLRQGREGAGWLLTDGRYGVWRVESGRFGVYECECVCCGSCRGICRVTVG